MSKQYQSFYQLLAQDQNAQNYFLDLPDYVRDQIELNPQNISSLHSLQGRVDQIMNTSFYS